MVYNTLRLAIFTASYSIAFLLCSVADAGFIISFSTDGRENTVFTVAPGAQSQIIPVYLVQTGSESRLLDLGAFSAGTTIQFSGGPGASTYTANSASFHSSWTDSIASEARFDGNALRLEGVTDGNPLKGSFLQIGSFRMTAGTDGNSTTLTTSLQNNVADVNLLIDGTPITPDAVILENRLAFGTATMITAVPEPTSLLLVGVATAFFLSSRSRRRRD